MVVSQEHVNMSLICYRASWILRNLLSAAESNGINQIMLSNCTLLFFQWNWKIDVHGSRPILLYKCDYCVFLAYCIWSTYYHTQYGNFIFCYVYLLLIEIKLYQQRNYSLGARKNSMNYNRRNLQEELYGSLISVCHYNGFINTA